MQSGRCCVCLSNTKFKCICNDWFCTICALEEKHDGTTIKCSHCKRDTCTSYMSTYEELNVCYSCGKLLQKKHKIEKSLQSQN